MKRDPNLEQLLRGELLAMSPLGHAPGRDAMLEALLDLAPAYTQRDPRDPGIAMVDALAAVLEIFGFYHDRILTESKIGSAQLLQSVAQLGDIVGYTPRPAIAAITRQFFEARTLGVIPAGSKLAARLPDVPGKVIFETLRALTIGPAFNRMALDPIVTRHVGAMRAVLYRQASAISEILTPLDEFTTGALAMINGLSGLELTPIAGARSRAIAVTRGLRRSYGPTDARIHCATEYRRLRNGQPLGPKGDPEGRDDIIAFEVSDRPILHIPDPASPRRLRSTLEVHVFDQDTAHDDPRAWTAARRWEEVPDFAGSEAADHHYRIIVDDRMCTYVLLRRRMGYRTLLSDIELEQLYVRFTPAVGDIHPNKLAFEMPSLDGFVRNLNHEYFINPLVLPLVDGLPVRTLPSDWVVTDRSLELTPGRQIIIENADTGQKFVRTLGPRTLEQYLSWNHYPDDSEKVIDVLDPPPRPLWAHIHDDVIAPQGEDIEPTSPLYKQFRKALFLQTFGHYFPLDVAPEGAPEDAPSDHRVSYPVLTGHGALHAIDDDLLFVETIPSRHEPIAGWSERGSLSISPLRAAAKAGPYHLWDQFYRQFENLDWSLAEPEDYELLEALQGTDTDIEPGPLALGWKDEIPAKQLAEMTIVPRGSTFLIVQDTSLIRPGDYFLLGKRARYHCTESEVEALHKAKTEPLEEELQAVQLAELKLDDEVFQNPPPSEPFSAFDPQWRVAEVLQAVEVHGRIVRLKWPTQNEYTVDFIHTDTKGSEDAADWYKLDQPVTELIIVPQVASVFYGEKFRQKLILRPNQELHKAAEPLLPGEMTLMKLKPELKAKQLRLDAGWPDLDDVEPPELVPVKFEEIWADLFLANIVDPPAHEILVGHVPAPGEMSLEWVFLVSLRVPWSQGGLQKDDIVGILVGLASLSTPYILAPVTYHSTFGVGFTFSVGAADLATAWDDPDLADDPALVRHWALVNHPKFVWSGAELEWLPGQSKLIIDEVPGYDLDFLVPEGSLLKIGPIRLARVTVSAQGELEIEMLDGLAIQVAKPIVTLYAVPATLNASRAEAYLMLTGTVVQPLPVFLPAWLIEGDFDFEDYAPAARYPQVHPESGQFHIERFAVETNRAQFMAALAEVQDGPGSVYHWYENKIGSLDKAKYLEDNEHNFLRKRRVGDLVLAQENDLKEGEYLLFSIKSAPTGIQGAAGALGQKVDTVWQFLTESVIFNSGNFIPVRLGEPEVDHKIVANSIDVNIDAVEGVPAKKGEYSEDLRDLLEKIKELEEQQENLPDDSPYNQNLLAQLGEQFHFSFNKTPEGTFTLNFLLMGYYPKSLPDGIPIFVDVKYTAEPYQAKNGEPEQVHHATYAVCKDEPMARWAEARFYQFETRPLPWNPLRQLVILNAGDLKAGDYLFIDPSGVDEELASPCQKPPPPPPTDVRASEAGGARDYIQWTRVVEVDGRMVMIDPPVKIQPRAFYHYRVAGYRRPAAAATPDPDYYTLLGSGTKKQTDPEHGPPTLSFGNRLMLLPFVEEGPLPDTGALVPIQRRWLLDDLVPGDRLLVWDERWRQAWHDHRVAGGEQTPPWYEWPDRQHEVVIKRIVPRLGLVELEQRMPQRFGVVYEDATVDPGDSTVQSVNNFRALPFYREPFQGHRELVAIGDGDRRLKFARLHAAVAENLGLGSVALDRAGTVASNIEVLTVDPTAGEWARWTEFGDIDGARARDRAFVLGLTSTLSEVPECGPVVEQTPGGPAEAECCCPDRAHAPAEQSAALELPHPDATIGEFAVQEPGAGTRLVVSFGDGVHGQLLPNGKANIFIRPVQIGRWCAHFQRRAQRQILSARQDCLPVRIASGLASAKNLVLLVEHGAHDQWRPRGGHHDWPSSIVVELDLRDFDPALLAKLDLTPQALAELERELPQDGILRLYAVSDAEARDGRDGLLVRPVRPGVIELFVVLRPNLSELLLSDQNFLARVKLFDEPRTATWNLDRSFYDRVMASDPTVGDGADVVLLAETEGLAEGSLLGFNASGDARDEVEVVEVAEVSHATYSATLASGLQRTYDLARSHLQANLVEAVQGSSDRHVIGSGDGATRSLRLSLGNREPILYSTMPAQAPGELAPGVVVLVDDIAWRRVTSFEGRGPRERVYCLEIEASGKAHVRFGDGQSGAIPAAGLDNITAVLRTGDGGRGNVATGAVDKLLDGNLAVERTRNVTPGVGGKAADDAAQAREHLMTRSFTHGRVITHDDILRGVRALSNVVQARLDPTAPASVVKVVVALAQRQPVTEYVRTELARRITDAMPIAANVTLELVDAVQLGVHVVLEISVNPGFFEGEVVRSLEAAFAPRDGGFFDLERWPIGAPLRVGDIYEHAFASPGVATARVRWLSRQAEPMELPNHTVDGLWPEPGEVVRCDSDRTQDTNHAHGNFRVQIKRGGR